MASESMRLEFAFQGYRSFRVRGLLTRVSESFGKSFWGHLSGFQLSGLRVAGFRGCRVTLSLKLVGFAIVPGRCGSEQGSVCRMQVS